MILENIIGSIVNPNLVAFVKRCFKLHYDYLFNLFCIIFSNKTSIN